MDLSTYEPMPPLADALRRRAKSIAARWQSAVRLALPAADELTMLQLLDSLPESLEQLAAALERDNPWADHQFKKLAHTHGGTRQNQRFTIADLMLEYAVLRPLLVEETTAELGRPLSIQEIAALDLAVDVAARRSVVHFAEETRLDLLAVVEAQSRNLSYLSHEVRGGLNGVLLMIEVVRRELAGEQRLAKTLGDLEIVRRTILSTVSTMERFLHAERFRKGKVQVNLTEFDLAQLARELTSQIEYQAKEKGVSVHTEAPSTCLLRADRELVALIIQNLLGNAVKFSKRGRILVRVDSTDGCHRVAVTDDGPGIPEEKLAGLFDPYTRGDTHGQPGAGLGLSIARQAADLMGAKLWVESLLGKGSTFYLELPRAAQSGA